MNCEHCCDRSVFFTHRETPQKMQCETAEADLNRDLGTKLYATGDNDASQPETPVTHVQVALKGAGQLLTEYERLADLVKGRARRLEEDRGEFFQRFAHCVCLWTLTTKQPSPARICTSWCKTPTP